MPYSDPEQKRQYMKQYNPTYYEANRDTHNLVTKNINRKKSLRETKMDYITDCIGINCYYCGGESDGEIKMSLEIDPSLKPLPKALNDHSWSQIKIMSNSGVIKNICSVCKKIGTPEEYHRGS